MMAEQINPISAESRLAQILGEDYLAQAPGSSAQVNPGAGPAERLGFTGNPFEDVLARAVKALDGVSRSEIYANQMVDGYLRGEVELHDVMVAQSKMSIMVQLAVTTVNSAVNTFKEIIQMQI
ncbi:flagellar hook-basal body complex protein FliE [Candidatus Margulisiibacteriota bacterium]